MGKERCDEPAGVTGNRGFVRTPSASAGELLAAYDRYWRELDRLLHLWDEFESGAAWTPELAARLEKEHDVLRDKLADLEKELAATPSSSIDEAAGKARLLLGVLMADTTDSETALIRGLCEDVVALAETQMLAKRA